MKLIGADFIRLNTREKIRHTMNRWNSTTGVFVATSTFNIDGVPEHRGTPDNERGLGGICIPNTNEDASFQPRQSGNRIG